jgi:hypothetical protein
MKSLCLLSLLLLTINVSAQWSENPYQNNIIVKKPSRQKSSQITTDGSGGAIITWHEYIESKNDMDIYAQKINSQGVIQWGANGVPVCTNDAYTDWPSIVSDGNGGAIIYWSDSRNMNKNVVYAQRINSEGVTQWTTDGVSVGTVEAHYSQGTPAGASDENGGIILVWKDWRRDGTGDVFGIYGQRISAGGSIMWDAGGKPLSTIKGEGVVVTADGSGGVVAAWQRLIMESNQIDIIAQRISSNGAALWGNDGVSVCSLTTDQRYPEITGDGNGGAIIVWLDRRNSELTNLYTQKLNSSGIAQWTSNGMPLCSRNKEPQVEPTLMSDGNGGAYYAWSHNFNVSYAQHLNAAGEPQWQTDGVSLGTDRKIPRMTTDGSSGIIVACNTSSGDIYAQRVNSAGYALWGVNGAAVSRADSYQLYPKICAGSNGAAIITWEDYRDEPLSAGDVYAQRISSDGNLGISTAIAETELVTGNFTVEQNHPNPFSGETRINFTVIRPGIINLKVLNATGTSIRTLLNERFEPGFYSAVFDASGLSEGVYYFIMKSGNEIVAKKMIFNK